MLMLLPLFFGLTLGLLASLLPFAYPESLVLNVVGAHLNSLMGEFLVNTLNVGKGSLVDATDGTYALNLGGVMAVYGTPLALVLLVLRSR